MSHHKASALRAKAERLKKENAQLRRALAADREFWSHLLWCPECQLQTLRRLLCPEAMRLRQDHASKAHAAPKTPKTKE